MNVWKGHHNGDIETTIGYLKAAGLLVGADENHSGASDIDEVYAGDKLFSFVID